MAMHLEDPKTFLSALPDRVADSSSLAASNLASCPNRNPPSISSAAVLVQFGERAFADSISGDGEDARGAMDFRYARENFVRRYG